MTHQSFLLIQLGQHSSTSLQQELIPLHYSLGVKQLLRNKFPILVLEEEIFFIEQLVPLI